MFMKMESLYIYHTLLFSWFPPFRTDCPQRLADATHILHDNMSLQFAFKPTVTRPRSPVIPLFVPQLESMLSKPRTGLYQSIIVLFMLLTAEQTVLCGNADREHPHEECQHTWNGAYSETCSSLSTILSCRESCNPYQTSCLQPRRILYPRLFADLPCLQNRADVYVRLSEPCSPLRLPGFCNYIHPSQIMQKNRCLFLSNQSRRRSSRGWTEQTSPVGTRPTTTPASYIESKG